MEKEYTLDQIAQLTDALTHFTAEQGLIKIEENDTPGERLDKFLDFTSRKGSLELLKLLLEHTFDDSLKDKDEKSFFPLHWAAEKGYLELVRLLIEKGTDVHALNKDGRPALLLALQGGHREVAELLALKSK